MRLPDAFWAPKGAISGPDAPLDSPLSASVPPRRAVGHHGWEVRHLALVGGRTRTCPRGPPCRYVRIPCSRSGSDALLQPPGVRIRRETLGHRDLGRRALHDRASTTATGAFLTFKPHSCSWLLDLRQKRRVKTAQHRQPAKPADCRAGRSALDHHRREEIYRPLLQSNIMTGACNPSARHCAFGVRLEARIAPGSVRRAMARGDSRIRCR